jgi:hypothetical protein
MVIHAFIFSTSQKAFLVIHRMTPRRDPMVNERTGVLVILTVLVLLSSMILTPIPTNAQVSIGEHVYYGYVPPSTNIATATGGQVDEVIHGQKINYTVPSGVAILDVVGLVDGTNIEIWNIYSNQRLYSATLNKLEKKFFYIAFGTFFKVVASQRIAALLNGGSTLFVDEPGGTSTFYPAVTGGFRGKEYIFNAATPTDAHAYAQERIGYNFYLMALEETDWTLSDATGFWSATGHLHQRATKTTLLQSRVNDHGSNDGAGNDVVFHVTASSDVEVSCCAGISDFLAVPALTGGYVGKLFYAPVAVTFPPGRTTAFIVVPLEEGQVKIYDKNLPVIATHSFTASDVSDRNYWYFELGSGRFELTAESTGNIAFMVGSTEGIADISHLGDDITFMGSRPNQEIRFYAPTMAVVFAPEALTATIDGGAPVEMAKDDFRLLEPGVHSVSADKHVVVEVLASGSGWNNWGSYLIEPADADVSFEAPAGFTSKPVDYTMYIAVAAVAVVIAVLAVIVMRRRRPRQV